MRRSFAWVWFAAGFLAFVAAWVALIVIAQKNKPDFIPVRPAGAVSGGR